MKKPHLIIAILVPALLALAWFRFGTEQEEYQQSFQDEASARRYLKTQVADGNMTELEARLRLAEALVQINKKDRKKGYVRKIMEKQGLNEEEAKEYLIKLKLEKFKKSKFQKNEISKKNQDSAKEAKGK